MKKFIDKLTEVSLKAKNETIFGTYTRRVRTANSAVKKMEKLVTKKLDSLKRALLKRNIAQQNALARV